MILKSIFKRLSIGKANARLNFIEAYNSLKTPHFLIDIVYSKLKSNRIWLYKYFF